RPRNAAWHSGVLGSGSSVSTSPLNQKFRGLVTGDLLGHEKVLPTYTVHLVNERVDREPLWFDLGALWQNANGTLSGDTAFGRIVLLPAERHARRERARAR